MRTGARFGIAAAFLLATSLPQTTYSQTYSAAQFFPLGAGSAWTYSVGGVQDQRLADGASISSSWGGDRAYYTNASGLNWTQQVVTVDSRAGTMSFGSAVTMLNSTFALGQTLSSSGSLPLSGGCVGCHGTGTYSASTSAAAFDSITVPAGIFKALRVQQSLTISVPGRAPGSVTTTYWLARGVGMVRMSRTESTHAFDTGDHLLIGTNLSWVTPESFGFVAKTNVEPASVQTSAAIQVIGTTAPSQISIVNGMYSINGGAYTGAPGTVANGSFVTVRQTASASFNTKTSAILTIGGVSGTFDVTTRVADTIPNAFTFVPKTGSALNTDVASDSIPVTGIEAATTIAIVGGKYSLNGDPFTSDPGIVENGDTVSVQLTSAQTYETQRQAVLTIGGIRGVFSVTTIASPLVRVPSTLNLRSATRGGPVKLTTMLFNAGSVAIPVGGMVIDGANAADFAKTTNCGSSLVAGGTCTIEVSFTPTEPGVRLAEIAFVGALPDPGRVALIGNRGAGAFFDLDGDGSDDIVWRNTTSGANALWLMDGAGRVSDGSPGGALDAVADLNWKVAGAGDFDADGRTDLIWRDGVTGANAVWLMNATARVGGGAPPTVTNLAWRIVGTGDFNGDGKADLLWRQVLLGANAVWFMNGSTKIGGGALPAVADNNWKVVGTGDFNDDGKSDIVWRNAATGANSIWLMRGLVKIGGGSVAALTDLHWRLAGTGDLDRDGKSDLVWQHATTGANALWLMNGVQQLSTGAVPVAADAASWRIEQVSDFDADGMADILLRHTASGANTIWLMNGTSKVGGNDIPALSDVNWKVMP